MAFVTSPDSFTQLTAAALETTDFLFLWNPNTTLLPKMQLFAISQLIAYLDDIYVRDDLLWTTANRILTSGSDRKTQDRTIVATGAITVECVGNEIRFNVTPGAVADATDALAGAVLLNTAGTNLVYRKDEVDALITAANTAIGVANTAIAALNVAVAAIDVSPGANLSLLNLANTDLIGTTTSDGQLICASNPSLPPLTTVNLPRTPVNYPLTEVLNLASMLRILHGVSGRLNGAFAIPPDSTFRDVTGFVSVGSASETWPTLVTTNGSWVCTRTGTYECTFLGEVWASAGVKIHLAGVQFLINGSPIGFATAKTQAISSGLEFAPLHARVFVILNAGQTIGIRVAVFPFGAPSGNNSVSNGSLVSYKPVSFA